jgi:hypothetical protein
MAIEQRRKLKDVLDYPVKSLTPFSKIVPSFTGPGLPASMPFSDYDQYTGKVIIALLFNMRE